MRLKEMKSKLDIINDVINNQQYTKISMLLGTKRKTVILDFQTANLLKKLFDTSPTENIGKLQKLGWDRLCNMAWSMIK
jgi:hypothetical protein